MCWSAVGKRGEAWMRIKGNQGSYNGRKTGGDQHTVQDTKRAHQILTMLLSGTVL